MTEPEVETLPPELEEPAPEVVAPDRADAPVSVITERFLKTVVEHVALDRIEELHLFSPLRQGGVETGIAVIAARVPVPLAAGSDAVELPFSDAELPLGDNTAPADPVDMPADPADMPTDEEAPAEVLAEGLADTAVAAPDEAEEVSAPVTRERHTVYTARYRLVQKGPERGKWEADVVAEADAPLITVETVVRGVQRRAGEESEILRFSAKQIAHALRVEWPLAAPEQQSKST
jgi:hypothetical protein